MTTSRIDRILTTMQVANCNNCALRNGCNLEPTQNAWRFFNQICASWQDKEDERSTS